MTEETKWKILQEIAAYNVGPVLEDDVTIRDIMEQFSVTEDKARGYFDRYLQDHPDFERVEALNPNGGPNVKVIRKKLLAENREICAE